MTSPIISSQYLTRNPWRLSPHVIYSPSLLSHSMSQSYLLWAMPLMLHALAAVAAAIVFLLSQWFHTVKPHVFPSTIPHTAHDCSSAGDNFTTHRVISGRCSGPVRTLGFKLIHSCPRRCEIFPHRSSDNGASSWCSPIEKAVM